jgi:hypothetical protein
MNSMGMPKHPHVLIAKHDKYSDMGWYLANQDTILMSEEECPIEWTLTQEVTL